MIRTPDRDRVFGEERSDPARYRLRALEVQQMTDSFDLLTLDARHRRKKQIVDLDPERLGVRTEQGQRRLSNARRFPRVEGPPLETRQLHSEEGVGVTDRLFDHSGDALLE
jgi:hypothetical protein